MIGLHVIKSIADSKSWFIFYMLSYKQRFIFSYNALYLSKGHYYTCTPNPCIIHKHVPFVLLVTHKCIVGGFSWLSSFMTRSRPLCQHGKSKYDCPVCGTSRCSHNRRTRNCKTCRPQEVSFPSMKLQVSTYVIKEHPVQEILPLGCRCPEERKFRSSIVGCGSRHGCNFDTLVCSVCHRTHRYMAWAKACCRIVHPMLWTLNGTVCVEFEIRLWFLSDTL